MPLEKLAYQLTVRTTIHVVATASALMGVDMALSGPARFGSPGLATARLIPGGVYAWAAVFLAGGLLTLVGSVHWRRPVVMAGLMWLGLAFGFFDVSLWWTRFNDPTTAVTGCWTYLMVATTCAVLYAGGHELNALEGSQP